MIEERKVSVTRAQTGHLIGQSVSLGNASSKAPMGRSAIAQGNALGSIGVMVRRPEGAEPNGEEFHTEVFGDEAALSGLGNMLGDIPRALPWPFK
jgi:hypothetical protein